MHDWSACEHNGPSVQVDALEFYRERIQALADAIKAGSEQLLRNPDSTLPAAFVTFKTRTAQVTRPWPGGLNKVLPGHHLKHSAAQAVEEFLRTSLTQDNCHRKCSRSARGRRYIKSAPMLCQG